MVIHLSDRSERFPCTIKCRVEPVLSSLSPGLLCGGVLCEMGQRSAMQMLVKQRAAVAY